MFGFGSAPPVHPNTKVQIAVLLLCFCTLKAISLGVVLCLLVLYLKHALDVVLGDIENLLYVFASRICAL